MDANNECSIAVRAPSSMSFHKFRQRGIFDAQLFHNVLRQCLSQTRMLEQPHKND